MLAHTCLLIRDRLESLAAMGLRRNILNPLFKLNKVYLDWYLYPERTGLSILRLVEARAVPKNLIWISAICKRTRSQL